MSLPLITISCEKCNSSEDVYTGNKIYYYRLINGDKILAPYLPGYCFHCKKLSHILLGFSSAILTEEKEKLKKTLDLFAQINPCTKELENERFSIRKELEEKENLLLLLDGKTSRHYCLKCSSTDVYPYFGIRGKYWPDEDAETSFIHYRCGGRLHIKQVPIRFSYDYVEVIVDPEY